MTAAKGFGLLLAIIVVAVAVALTYFYFEAVVRNSIDYVWDTLFSTDTRRLLIVPLCFVIGLVFFWLQHHFDPASETHQSEGLGEAPSPTVMNFVKVIGLGFFSLLAGASLGPEAILVPACIIIGGYVGASFFKTDKLAPKLLGMVGFVALLAAFFNSFIAGMLGLLLVTKQVHIKLNAVLVVVAALASLITVYVLKLLSSKAYAKLPPSHWKLSLSSLLVLAGLIAAGYVAIYAMHGIYTLVVPLRGKLASQAWWVRWLVASSGLSILYLLGGSLVEFTGNESIVPMLNQAAKLGVVGLLWILVVKLAAISWSKGLSYRGGLAFPTIFVASVLVAIAQHYFPNVSFILGLIAVMAGAIAANRKVKILF
jgi:H+/Cl- antiporter ClcA